MASVNSPAVTKLSPPKQWVVQDPSKCFPFSFIPLATQRLWSLSFIYSSLQSMKGNDI